MAPQKEEDDQKQEQPEERKGLLDRIGDFLKQPLPGTAPRAEESEPEIGSDARPLPPVAPPQAVGPSMGGGGPVITRPPLALPPGAAPIPEQPAGRQSQTPNPGRPPSSAFEQEEYAEKSGTAPSPSIVRPDQNLVSEIQKETGIPGGKPEVAPGTLVVGGSAYVRREGGMPLRLRSAPDINIGTIVARLPIGMHLTLIEGPQHADGYEWWHVRTADGRTGWVAGSELVTQPE